MGLLRIRRLRHRVHHYSGAQTKAWAEVTPAWQAAESMEPSGDLKLPPHWSDSAGSDTLPAITSVPL